MLFTKPDIEAIDACLPQTQCTQCGYPRCREYAKAITSGVADINQCPPGHDTTIGLLADLTNVESKFLNPKFGEHQPRRLAFIVEVECIGCTLCIQACPVDAISGAGKLMHTVIADECSGCNLCLPACPVDCIQMQPVNSKTTQEGRWPEYTDAEVQRYRLRSEQRVKRLQNKNQREKKSIDLKQDIMASVSRVRARRARTDL